MPALGGETGALRGIVNTCAPRLLVCGRWGACPSVPTTFCVMAAALTSAGSLASGDVTSCGETSLPFGRRRFPLELHVRRHNFRWERRHFPSGDGAFRRSFASGDVTSGGRDVTSRRETSLHVGASRQETSFPVACAGAAAPLVTARGGCAEPLSIGSGPLRAAASDA